MKLDARHVLAAAGLIVAGVFAYAATRTAGPVPMPKYTELRMGPLFEHLVSEAELLTQPVYVPHHYPPRVGPQISSAIGYGYAPQYQPPDPQVAALPAEEPW